MRSKGEGGEQSGGGGRSRSVLRSVRPVRANPNLHGIAAPVTEKGSADLLPPDQDIVIGGDRPENIPIPTFQELLRKFPNTTKMNHYAAARVASVVGDYFALMKDAQGRY
jgi:hypothetical protein